MHGVLTGLALLAATSASAQEFNTYKGHGGPIMGLAVDGTGQLASASFDNSVGLWNERTPIWLEGHDAAVTAITFGPRGELVTGGDDFMVRQWRPVRRELGRHKGKVTALDIAPDGSFVASASWDGEIRLWPLENAAARAFPAPGGGVNAVVISPDGASLFAATSTGELWRYNLADDTRRPVVRHGFGINRLVLGPGWLAFGAVDGGTRVIDTQTDRDIADFTLDRRPILALAYHDSSHQLAVGDGQGYIMVIDTSRWQIARDFRAMRQGPVWALAFSPDGSHIYAGGLDDVVYSWPVAFLDEFDPAGAIQREFHRDPETMPNGERQFMRKCSICHSLDVGPSRKAGPTLHGLFGRRAGILPGYRYSDTLDGSEIIWSETTVDALFDLGPDNFIPGSKMPMQVISDPSDRSDLIEFLKSATRRKGVP